MTSSSRPHDEYVLFGYGGSGSAAIECALELANLPYRSVEAASWDEQSQLQALQAVNPLLQIPALRFPDGSTMTESAAILIELGLRHPDAGLLPTAPAQRAQALRGLVFIAANCYAAIGIDDYPERWTTSTDAPARDALRQGTRQRLHALWTVFADSFPASPWLSGPALGALDLLAAVVSRWSGTRAHLQAERPQWSEVLQRIEAHPGVAGVFARHWPSATTPS